MPESKSEPNLLNETIDPAKLNNRQRGHLAELAFMRKAASLGLSVAKPWGEGERYDVIVRVESVCWRVQVKSVLAKSPGRKHYKVALSGRGLRCRHKPYSAKEIDFLAAYLFAEDLWYIFPVAAIEKKDVVYLSPGSKRSRLEKYREAWKLMHPAALAAHEDRVSCSGATVAQPANPAAARSAKAGST